MGYAKLLLRVYPRRYGQDGKDPFDGQLMKQGAVIEQHELWPSADYPSTPILLEYAGTDRQLPYRPGRLANSIYILWRYDLVRCEWVEVTRALAKDAGWLVQIVPVAYEEIARNSPPRDATYAAAVSRRILDALDNELDRLTIDDRDLVMHFVYEQFTARAVTYSPHSIPLFDAPALAAPASRLM